MADAFDLLRARRGADGRWCQDGPYPGRVWFDVDVAAGEPSRWLTLRATAVLDWWDGERAQG